mgnify:CR=1 FL=1
MARFLVKSEPSTYSFADLQRDKRTVWDGVSNPVAIRHMATIRKGDTVIVYHTGDEKQAIGLAIAASDAYPDVPILGYTNHTDTAGLRAANAAGFDQVIVKSALVERAPQLVAELVASVE